MFAHLKRFSLLSGTTMGTAISQTVAWVVLRWNERRTRVIATASEEYNDENQPIPITLFQSILYFPA
jgi:hypothetical protein